MPRALPRDNGFFIPPRIWPGGTVFVIGGGPSLSRMDLSPLSVPGRRVIGVNDAYKLGNWVDVCFFGDSPWYDWQQRRERVAAWASFPGLRVTIVKRLINAPGVKVMLKGKPQGIDPNPGRISWNKNSGSAAVNLAVHFGAKRIVLLGFDMKPDENGKTNYHDNHLRVTKTSVYHNLYLPNFKIIAQDAEALGVEILNATPGSAIQEFPFVTLEDVCR